MTGNRRTPEQTDAELRARVRAQVAESRRRQGLPPTVTDPAFREQLAARVADGLVQKRRERRERRE